MTTELTEQEKATNYETLKHILLVGKNINTVIMELLARAERHDSTKLLDPELRYFVEFTPKLSGTVYGSAEYNQYKDEMKPALDHHYANNRHHPEHHKNGIDDMNLVDIVEMFCDWAASCKRHATGNLNKSCEINGKRFDMSPQLVRIFENTISMIEHG